MFTGSWLGACHFLMPNFRYLVIFSFCSDKCLICLHKTHNFSLFFFFKKKNWSQKTHFYGHSHVFIQTFTSEQIERKVYVVSWGKTAVPILGNMFT